LAAVNSTENKILLEKQKALKEENDLMKLNTILNDKNSGSLEKATALNKKLDLEKNKLNLETKEGVDRLKEINIQQDKNNDLIAASANKLQTQKIGIGNYKSGFAELTTAFKNGEIGLKGLTTGFFQMGKATVIALGPIALLIAPFVLLYAVFKNFAPLIDKIEQGFAGLTAAWSVLKNSLGQFLSGNQSLKESMSGVGDSMKEAARDAASLKKADQELEDQMGGLEIANKKLETQMKQLLLQSKNKTLSEKEQMELIDQAIALENQQFENKKKINDEDLRISQENIKVKNKLTEDQYNKLKELGVDYAETLIDQGIQIDRKDVDRLKAALLAEEDNKQESIGIVEKAMNRKDSIEEKAIEAELKRREKQAAEEEKATAKAAEEAKKLVESKQAIVDSELALMAEGEEKQIAISKETLKRKLEDLKANGQLTDELEKNLTTAHGNDIQKIKDDFAKQAEEKRKTDLDTAIADFEKNTQKEIELLSAGYRQKESDLKKEYSKGLMSREDYEAKLLQLQEAAAIKANAKTIERLQKELETAELTVDKKLELSNKIRDIQIENENPVTDAVIKANEKQVESEKGKGEKSPKMSVITALSPLTLTPTNQKSSSAKANSSIS